MTKYAYIQIINWADGKKQLRINRPEQAPEDFEISPYEAIGLAADLLCNIGAKKDDT